MGHLINVLDDDITTYFYHLKKTSIDHLDIISLQYEERMRIQKAGGTVRYKAKIGLLTKNDKRLKENKKNRKKSELGIFTDDPEGR